MVSCLKKCIEELLFEDISGEEIRKRSAVGHWLLAVSIRENWSDKVGGTCAGLLMYQKK